MSSDELVGLHNIIKEINQKQESVNENQKTKGKV